MAKKSATKKKEQPSPAAEWSRHREMKARFIKALAVYLAKDQVKQSIKLECGDQDAKVWLDVRRTTPLFGYPSVEEAEKVLTEFLA